MADNWDDVDEDDWENLVDAPVVVADTSSSTAPPKSENQWDDEEEEDDDVKPAKPAPAPRNPDKQAKSLTKPKPKSKKVTKAVVEETSEDSSDSKIAVQQREIAADFDSAVDLFADSGERVATPDELITFENLTIRTQKDFNKLLELITTKLSNASELPSYPLFVKELTKKLLAPSSNDEVKDVVRTLNALSTEKVAAEKSRPKKKKVFTKRIKDDDLEEDLVDGEFDAFM